MSAEVKKLLEESIKNFDREIDWRNDTLAYYEGRVTKIKREIASLSIKRATGRATTSASGSLSE